VADARAGVVRGVTNRLRWIHLAPILAMLTLGVWAFASPVGAGPDDDYHLASVWCTRGGTAACQPGVDSLTREVDTAFRHAVCFARSQTVSAQCQERWGLELDGPLYLTNRGNFKGDYPAPYYATMRVFADDDLVKSALTMRLVNTVLFVGLGTALAWLLSGSRRQTLLWGWLTTLIPLGMFIIPSNNPSGWTVTGVGTAYLAALGWMEASGRRRWALGAIYILGVLIASGSRADGATYVIGASAVAALLTLEKSRTSLKRIALLAVGVAIAFAFYLTADTAGAAAQTVSSGGVSSGSGVVESAEPTGGAALALYNLLQIPDLWTGVWGTWGLGWLDTPLPALVPWSMVAVFAVVGFSGLAHLNWRKAMSIAGVLSVLVALPVFLLTRSGNVVGDVVQPRYFLPLIVLFAMLLVTGTPGARAVRLTRTQTALVLLCLAAANALALQVNIRRYVTGTDTQGINLDAGAEWWWDGALLGPTITWALGSAAFAGLLAVLWPLLRAKDVAPAPRLQVRASAGEADHSENVSSRS
jgi:hypothetical protein